MALRCKWYHIWFHVSCLVHGLHGVRFRDGTLAHWITYSVGGLVGMHGVINGYCTEEANVRCV